VYGNKSTKTPFFCPFYPRKEVFCVKSEKKIALEVQRILKVHNFASVLKAQYCLTHLKVKEIMKKLVFAFAAVVAMSFASCGGNTKPAETADTVAADTVVVEDTVEVAADTVAADTVK
jgi:hypothetical protein